MRSDNPYVFQVIFSFVYSGNVDIDNAHVLLTFSTRINLDNFSTIFGAYFRNFLVN